MSVDTADLEAWLQFITSALIEADSATVPVVGSRLYVLTERKALAEGKSLRDFLIAQKLRFSDLVRKVPGVTVYQSRGADITVSLTGAQPVESTQEENGAPLPSNSQLRDDIYRIFTKVRGNNAYYDPAKDTFYESWPGEQSLVVIPPVTIDELIAARSAFSAQQTQEHKNTLDEALVDPESALKNFRNELDRCRLARKWHKFNVVSVLRRITDWAASNQLSVRPSWIKRPSESPTSPYSEKKILIDLIGHMTPEELSEIRVPLGAVARYLRSQS